VHGGFFRILEQVLAARIRRRLLTHPAIAYPLRPSSLLRLGDLVGEAGYSAKHIIALFQQAVGLTPKLYCRTLRFKQVVHCLAPGSTQLAASWASDLPVVGSIPGRGHAR
jgi:AraC-like DNA-binding protein